MIRFQAIPVTLDAAPGDGETPRTITGVAVPWDKPAVVMSGEKVKFMRGAFDLNAKAAKLIENHDMTQLRGTVSELVDSPEGLLFTATFAKTRAANDAIELVKAGAYDAVSVGAVPTKVTHEGDTTIVHKANLVELSLVPYGAFADAVITEIAASEPEEVVPESTPNEDSPKEETTVETPISTTVEAAPQIVNNLPLFAEARREVRIPTAAEYIAAMCAGGAAFQEVQNRLQAAAPDVKTTDTPGLLPTPIVQPVYNNFRNMRPVVDSIGVKAMPGSGKVFIRPSVTTHVSEAVQSAESAALQQGTYVVSSNTVTKGVYGGYVKISEQDIDWTDPNVVSLILDDMARIYANTTDSVAATNLTSGASVTKNFASADLAKPEAWTAWLYGAASTILGSSNGNLPDTLWLSKSMWSQLGQLVDSQKRPLFPTVGPMNAFGAMSPASAGQNAFGLNVVVDRNLSDDTIILGVGGNGDSAGMGSGFEIFEQQRGALSLINPDTITRTLSWHGYFATLMIDSSKFVKAAFV